MSNDIMKLADEYAHCYAFVGDDTMPLKRAELEAAIATLRNREGELVFKLARQQAYNEKPCANCNDTGDVHRADGEYLGHCDCVDELNYFTDKAFKQGVDSVTSKSEPVGLFASYELDDITHYLEANEFEINNGLAIPLYLASPQVPSDHVLVPIDASMATREWMRHNLRLGFGETKRVYKEFIRIAASPKEGV